MRKKVLIVDCSLYSRMILRDLLSCNGYSVCEASSGAQALEQYRKLLPDLLMVDANPKDMDGAQIIENVRREHPNVVAVICASAGQRGVVSQAFSAGASAFCAKPYREKSIKDALRNLNRQPVYC
ncbi:MAG: response regulator [Armatimonadetes bacterium]|nr:response regulator [Armatimonadota bacterium]